MVIDFVNSILLVFLLFFTFKNMVEIKQFTKFYKFRHKLKDDLETSCSLVISEFEAELKENHLQSFGDRLRTLMIEGRKATLDFAKTIHATNLKVDEQFLENELSRIFDNLKMLTMTYFREKKLLYPLLKTTENIKTLATYFRDCSNIKRYMEILKIQLIEIKSGKYNGHSNEKFIDNIREFMENVMREGFKKAMEFDKLKTYFEDEKSN